MRIAPLIASLGVLACGGNAIGVSGDSGSVGRHDGATDAADGDVPSEDAADTGAEVGPIAFVDSFTNGSSPWQIPLTESAGDLLVLPVYTGHSCSTPPPTMTVSDTAGNIWSLAAHQGDTSPGGGYPVEQAQIWYALDAKAGSNTVTITVSECDPGAVTIGTVLLEYSGVAPAGALDGIAGAIAATASNEMDTGPLVTSGKGDLVVGVFADNCDMSAQGFIGPGPGYHAALLDHFFSGLVEDNPPYSLSPGTSHVIATLPSGMSDACWIAVAAAFKPG
jgi:hypothetical protein